MTSNRVILIQFAAHGGFRDEIINRFYKLFSGTDEELKTYIKSIERNFSSHLNSFEITGNNIEIKYAFGGAVVDIETIEDVIEPKINDVPQTIVGFLYDEYEKFMK